MLVSIPKEKFVVKSGSDALRVEFKLGMHCFRGPMVAFPQWTDQLTIAMLIPDVWKTGVRVTKDEDGIVEGGEIKSCMESVMGERRKVEKECPSMEGFSNGNSYHEKWAFRQQS